MEDVTPPVQERIDDDGMKRAVRLLVDAVTREFRPGGHYLKLAASTLRDLLDTPTPQSFSLAAKAFNAIDSETRRRIRANAEDAATIFCTRTGKMVVPKPLAPATPLPDAYRELATGLLKALNVGFGRSGAAKGGAAGGGAPAGRASKT